MNRTVPALAALFCIVAINPSPVHAEKPKPAATAETPGPAVDPALAKALEAAQKSAAPGEAHKALELLAGSWTYTAQFWMAPEAQPQPMSGISTHVLIFGGRFLKQEIRGQAKGMPAFEGIGLIGYDNLRKEYQSVWLDNMATGMMIGSGQFNGASQAVPAQGDFSCPVTGEAHRKYRSLWRVVDANHNTYESYFYTPEGTEFKSMEINYTRQSAPCPPTAERC